MVAVVGFDSAVINYKTCSLALVVDTDPANVFYNGVDRYCSCYGVLIALQINRVTVNLLYRCKSVR